MFSPRFTSPDLTVCQFFSFELDFELASDDNSSRIYILVYEYVLKPSHGSFRVESGTGLKSIFTSEYIYSFVLFCTPNVFQ